MNSILPVIMSNEILANQQAAKASQQWLSKTETVGMTQFYPSLSALTIICHLEPKSAGRKALADAIREDIAADFENPIIPELLDWYLNDYKGDSLAVEINTIIENSGERFYHSDDLIESLWLVWEAATNKENQEAINDWFRTVLASVYHELVSAFDTYLRFMKKFQYENNKCELFSYCLGPDLGSILVEAVEKETITFDQYANLKELGEELKLGTLAFYADEEKSAMDMFENEYCEFDKDKCIAALSTIIEEHPSHFTVLLSAAKQGMESETFSEALGDALIDDDIEASFLALMSGDMSNETQAEVLYNLILSEDAFDKESEFKRAYSEGEEDGAHSEMLESLAAYSCFDLGETYKNEDGESLKITFDVKAVFDDANRDNDLFEFHPLVNHFTLESYLTDAIFHEKLTSKTNDFDTPYYGFSGFSEDLFQERTEELLKEIIDEQA